MSRFSAKTNFFKPALPKPHHCKLPSARTHWSTPKDFPLSLERWPKAAFTASPSGDRTCVTKRRDAGAVRAKRPMPATTNPSRELGVVQTLVHSFGTFLLHNRKVHFLTSRGRCGERPPRLKNSFFKNRFLPSVPACLSKAKELIIHKKAVPAGFPARTAN